MTEFNLELAKQLTQDAEANEFSVDFDLLWQWCGYSKKSHAKESLKKNFEEWLDYIEQEPQQRQWASTEGFSDHPPIRTIKIWTTPDCAKEFGMLAKTEQGKQVRKYFIRAEKELRRSMQENPLAHLEHIRDVLDQQIKQGYSLQLTKETVEEQQMRLENHEDRINATEGEIETLKEEIENNRNNPNVNKIFVSLQNSP
jgi:phage anti-repressor protein